MLLLEAHLNIKILLLGAHLNWLAKIKLKRPGPGGPLDQYYR